ncbi:MAG TPA: hypothetical protein VL095_09815 [Flavisolibacter sp.]|nr:hypothetical protein [Flavisolibacter sp.]
MNTTVVAQQQTYDLFTFTPPKKWSKVAKENSIIFSTTDNVKHTWAQIDIIKSTTSKGSIEDDFKSEWKDLVMTRYGVKGQPIGIDSQSFQGYKLWTGLGKFLVGKDTSSILLNTFSDGQRCISFILLSNTTAYGKTLDDFVSSVNLAKPTITQVKNNSANNITSSTPLANGFQFNTTNFDDGWTSVVKEDWVEATKGSVKVLLHYLREQDKNYYTQYDERLNVFWNLLVAPRYTNLRQYQSPGYNYSSEPGYYGAGLLNDNTTKKDVWVVLFSKGKSGWIEVIASDKASFVQTFGIDNPDRYFSEWDALLRLAGMNRFAVGENDLIGKWSNQFSNSSAYYSIYTGIYAGSSTYASSQSFVFEKTKTYQWSLAVGKSGVNTSMQVDKVSANGNWKLVNNWQVWFSEIERKPKTYNAYFSCIKGGRILWLQDVEYGSYTAYGKISN